MLDDQIIETDTLSGEGDESTVVTGPELAAVLGVDVRSVSRLAREGVVVRISRGHYALEPSAERYRVARGIGNPGAGDLAEERARLTRATADLLEGRVERLAAELLARDAVDATWASAAECFCAHLAVFPTYVATPLSEASSIGEAFATLTDAIHALLDTLAAIPVDYVGPPEPGNTEPLDDRTRLLRARALLAELKLARLRGDLLPAQTVDAAWSNAILAARTRVLSIPSRAAPQVWGCGPIAIEECLASLIDDAVNEIQAPMSYED